jgi:hypothetical protein
LESNFGNHPTLKTEGRIVWIDDNPDRRVTAENLRATFIDVKGKNLANVVAALFRKNQPRLVIIDHILDKTTSDDPLLQRGSTIAGGIKEKWPLCPVIGVTNANQVDDIDIRTKLAYDDLLPYANFSKYFDRISRIAQSFARIAKSEFSKPAEVLVLLKPPKDQEIRLEAALPDDIKSSPTDPSTGSRLYRWVNYLLDRPGFLYDAIWSATFLGLNQEGFKKVLGAFRSAEYSGVFNRSTDRRWWVSSLSHILYTKVPPQPGELSWHVGRRLPKINKSHYSKCYACGDEYPETVAFLDASTDEQSPMHLKCTALHPRYKRELYFEDVRIMRVN